MKGKRIRTLAALIKARSERRAVTWDYGSGVSVRPAAWMLNLPGEILHRLMKSGMWTYRAKSKRTSRKEIEV